MACGTARVDRAGHRGGRPLAMRRAIVHLRRQHHRRADRIAFEVGVASPTVQSILRAAGLGRLDRGDRATSSTRPQRYQRERPGEFVHVDVKKISAIPPGGGWRMHGKAVIAAGSTTRQYAEQLIRASMCCRRSRSSPGSTTASRCGRSSCSARGSASVALRLDAPQLGEAPPDEVVGEFKLSPLLIGGCDCPMPDQNPHCGLSAS
jgi:hypothetical protein